MVCFSLPFLCPFLLIISIASAQNSSQSPKTDKPVFRAKFYVEGQLIDLKRGMPASTNDFKIDVESPDPAREKVMLKKAVVTLASGNRRLASFVYYPNSNTLLVEGGWKAATGDRVMVELSELTVEQPGEKPATVTTRTMYTIPLY